MLSVAAIVVSAGLLIVSCGGTGEADSATPASTEPATTTTAAPATTTTPAAATTTTLSPAAGAPVETLAPLTDEEAEVVAALYEARTLAIESLMDPDSADLEERLDALYARLGGQQREVVEANLSYVRGNGLRVRVTKDRPWTLTVESVRFVDDPYPRADLQVCYVDTSILYEPNGAPDGSDAVVNEEFGAIRILYSLVVEDGSWQLFHGQNLSEMSLGSTECVPAG